ncbi:hypothetical protein P8452_75494 [Trifolium repens]|nr:hypothetical protein P8452_75494 [Trifolium repens]
MRERAAACPRWQYFDGFEAEVEGRRDRFPDEEEQVGLPKGIEERKNGNHSPTRQVTPKDGDPGSKETTPKVTSGGVGAPRLEKEVPGVQVGDIVVPLGNRKTPGARIEGIQHGEEQPPKDPDVPAVVAKGWESRVFLRKYRSKPDDVQWAQNGIVATVINGEAVPMVQNRIVDAGFNDLVITPMGADKEEDGDAVSERCGSATLIIPSDKPSMVGVSVEEDNWSEAVLSPVGGRTRPSLSIGSSGELGDRNLRTDVSCIVPETQDCPTDRITTGEDRSGFGCLPRGGGPPRHLVQESWRVLRHPVHSLKKLARLPSKDRGEALKAIGKCVRRRRAGVESAKSNSASSQDGPEDSSMSGTVNKDWMNWVAVHGNDQMAVDDVRGIGQTIGVTFKGDNDNMFNVLSRAGRGIKENSGLPKGKGARKEKSV